MGVANESLVCENNFREISCRASLWKDCTSKIQRTTRYLVPLPLAMCIHGVYPGGVSRGVKGLELYFSRSWLIVEKVMIEVKGPDRKLHHAKIAGLTHQHIQEVCLL